MNHAALSSPEFPPEPGAVRSARRWAADHASVEGAAGDTLALLVSELAANAVMHARAPFTVTLDQEDDHLRVAVSDQGHDVLPELRALDPRATSGRGLRMVAALVAAWGVESGPRPPTTVWFTLTAS